MKNKKRMGCLSTLLVAIGFLFTFSVQASLDEFYAATGKIFVSVDGAGSNDVGGHSIDVRKPSNAAVVRKAFLMASSTSTIADGGVELDGTPIAWDSCASVSFLRSCRADVTTQVKSVLDAATAGVRSFNLVDTGAIDGEALVVVFDDPAELKTQTVILMFGAQALAGDSFAITFAEAIDPASPTAVVDMGLGIGFGFQRNGGGQVSEVDVNGIRLTSSAGGEDDGISANGGLITVGGLGDSNDNPADPFAGPVNPRSDDELYSLLPFLNASDTGIDVDTRNPSNDDIMFFAYFKLSTAAIVGEGVVLSPLTATNPVGTNHTVTAKVVDDNGVPVENREVLFEVISGPNSGVSGSDTTDSLGNANFTYLGSAGAGKDIIRASVGGGSIESNVVEKIWESVATVACDVNNDGYVDIADIRLIRGANRTNNPLFDIDGNGIVNYNDMRQCVVKCDNARCAPAL